ncbi:tail assembly protein [Cupriavidus basilensis]|uniref:Tail assembly protein n=1 Tax=Cupriavidus basilensis TaxID=68895 RepID=A0ABT6AHS5_9BURK|nr:tail assembly protein [Cupriavidus basilensis]MDF3832154.1 tail assembly protein [Cupriavidus basilensis]
MLREIRLYGHLGKRFGRVHRFVVKSPAEAIAALKANFGAFENHLIQHNKPGYHVFVDEKNLGLDDLLAQTSAGVIKIVPVIAGRGKGGLQILIGAALIAAAFYTGGVMLAADNTLIAATTMGGIAFSMGVGLIVGGVAQMLTKSPAMSSTERPDNKPSYAFNGPVNTTQQGNPVPICYGELIVGSQVIYAGITTDEIPVDATLSVDNPTTGSVGI